jgi:phosphatidylglycerophosphatase A
MDRISTILATFFGVGRLPWAPGTWGSLAGLLLAWPFLDRPWVLAAAVVALTIISIPACTRAEALIGEKDPPSIVVDEVVGIWTALVALPHPQAETRIYYALMAFVLFRLFDIWKPFPWKKAQILPGGWGILVDDLGAGLYANLFLRVGVLGLSLMV